MATLLLNAMLFQVAWFACVLFAAAGMPWAGTSTALLILAWHLGLGPARPGEAGLIACAAVLGIVVDSALMRIGALHFSTGVLAPGLSPHWMVALWMILAATLRHSLGWLRPRLVLASVLGAAAGPASYWAGAKLGALSIPEAGGLLSVGVAWAAALPLLAHLASRFGRPEPRAP